MNTCPAVDFVSRTEGGTLAAMMDGGKVVFADEKGGTSTVTIANLRACENSISRLSPADLSTTLCVVERYAVVFP
jgi:hypothetical protein